MSAEVTAGGLILIMVGLANMFFGYVIFRVLLALNFAVIGAAFGAALGASIAVSDAIVVLCAILGGLILGALAYFLWSFGVFLMGLLFGGVLGAELSRLLGASDTTQLAIIIIGAAVVGLIALLLRKPIVIIGTAFTGASAVLAGVNLLAPDLAILDRTAGGTNGVIAFVIWVVLGLLGTLWQFSRSARWRASDAL